MPLATHVLVLLLVPGLVSAAGGGASSAPDWRATDAAVDRRLTSPTAQTLPAGEISLTSYDLFLGLGVSVGATDWLEASVSLALPVMGVVATAKGRVVAGDYVTASLQAGVGWFSERFRSNALTVGGLALADVHTGNGEVSFSAGAGVLGVFQDGQGSHDESSWGQDEASPYVVMTAGPTIRMGANVAALLEVEGAWSLGARGADGLLSRGFDSMTVNYGLRFHNRTVALDLAMLRPIALEWDGPWALGVPYAAIAVRF